MELSAFGFLGWILFAIVFVVAWILFGGLTELVNSINRKQPTWLDKIITYPFVITSQLYLKRRK